MYCPQCRAEYRDGFTECAGCGVPLVEELPPEAAPPAKPRLKPASLLAIIGVTYIFLSRTVGTFIPDLFRNITAAQVNVVLSIAAASLTLYFFVMFYREYVREEQETLRSASVLAIIGSALAVILYLKGLALFTGAAVGTDLANPGIVEAVVPLLSSIFLLIFFGAFYSESRSVERTPLKTALLLVITGFSVNAFLRTAVLFNYLFTGEFVWLSDIFMAAMPFLILPVLLFMYFTVVYFFAVFYRQQGKTA